MGDGGKRLWSQCELIISSVCHAQACGCLLSKREASPKTPKGDGRQRYTAVVAV